METPANGGVFPYGQTQFECFFGILLRESSTRLRMQVATASCEKSLARVKLHVPPDGELGHLPGSRLKWGRSNLDRPHRGQDRLPADRPGERCAIDPASKVISVYETALACVKACEPPCVCVFVCWCVLDTCDQKHLAVWGLAGGGHQPSRWIVYLQDAAITTMPRKSLMAPIVRWRAKVAGLLPIGQ